MSLLSLISGRLKELPFLSVAAVPVAAIVLVSLFSSGEGAETRPTPSTPLAGASAPALALARATATNTPPPTATPSPTPTATQVPPTPTPTPAPPFAVPARAIAILEAPCGAFLYGKDEHARLPPASLTKIVTALAAWPHLDLNERVASSVSAKELKRRTRSSVMGLEPGQEVTVEDLLYGLFLPSGNDAAIVLARHVAGSEDGFMKFMNETAAQLGMTNSHFSNSHGLDSSELYSSAYDMAVAGMELMKNPALAAIARAPSYSLEGGLTLKNGNRLLRSYPGGDGVKIGNTKNAKLTIVGSATRDGRQLYITVLGSEDLYSETEALLDWAFAETAPAC